MTRLFPSVLISLLLTACSPALNWRETRIHPGELAALLPCKPDHGSRPQRLAGQALEIRMQGCEAGGALFVVAMTETADAARVPAVQAQWQAHVLTNMQARLSGTAPVSIRGAGGPLAPVQLSATGLRPDGRGVHLSAVWFARDGRLYHAAIYAERITPEMSEPFFGALELP